MFQSSTRSEGDLAGVFEYDGKTGYFYLYEAIGNEGQKVLGAIRILTIAPDFRESDLEVRWNCAERNVGLFIRGGLWAAFDGKTRAAFGGNYCAGAQAQIPPEIISAFA